MLELFNASKAVRERGKPRWVLDGASVTIPRGRRIALLGASAEDNSLALRLLAGADHPDAGSARRSGLICWPFGVLSFLDMRSTMRENAVFLGRIYGLDAGEIYAAAAELSAAKPRRGAPLRKYPASDRRQIALGFTLAIQFDWYFIDEALPNVPAAMMGVIDKAVAERISRGGVIWATTDPDKLEGYCDAGLVLDRGALTFYDDFEGASDAFKALTGKRADERP